MDTFNETNADIIYLQIRLINAFVQLKLSKIWVIYNGSHAIETLLNEYRPINMDIVKLSM